jgi:hypothetical protein
MKTWGEGLFLMVEGLCRQNEADWLELEKRWMKCFTCSSLFDA